MWNPRTDSGGDAAKTQCFNLLALLYAFSRKVEFRNLKSGTRHDLVAELIALHIMEDAIILALCRMDDPDPRSWSLRELWKHEKKSRDSLTSTRIEQNLAKLRKDLKPLKDELRNKRIAHFSKTPPQLVKDGQDLSRLTSQVIALLDDILGAKQNYTLKVGAQEPRIDLRKAAGV